MDVVGPIIDPNTLSSLALEPTMTTTTTDEHGTTTTTIFNVPTIDGSSLLNAFPSCRPQGLVIATGPDGSGTVYIENQFVFSSTDNGTAQDVIQPAVTYVPVENADAPITAGDVQPAGAFIPAAENATDASMTATIAAVDVQPPVGKGPYRCQLCVKVFPKWTQLQRHLKKHADDKKFACTECDASFNFESNLVLHKATHNPDCSECPECGKRFSRTASLRAHIMVHEKEEYLVCNECGDEFPTQSKLDTHLKRHRDNDTTAQRNYVCKQCSQVFWTASAFRDHMKNHYRLKASLSRRTFKRNVDRSTFIHKCASCEKSFQKPSQLSRHTRIHTGERPFGCTQCGKTFNQKGALLIHQKKHSGEKPHTCEFCPAAFAQKGNLRAHIRRVHMVTTKDPSGGSGGIVAVTDGQTTTLYRCERCACAFRKLGSLNAHMSRMHSSEVSAIINGDDSSPNNGKTVNDVIKQIIQLSEHAEAADQADKENPSVRHSTDDILQQALQNSGLTSVQGSGGGNTKKTVEDGAAATATSMSNGDHCTSSIVAYADSATGALKRHVVKRVDGVRVHQCVYCVKVFKKPSDLVRHIRIHTREKPYKCSQCFRSFAVKSTLTAHVKAHSGVKEFGCDVCEKLFATQGSLRVHRRLHTGVKPFSCPHCTKFFRTSGHRKSHLITHGITSSTADGGEGNRKARQRRVTSNAALPEQERNGGGERRPPPVRRVARHHSPKEAVSSTVVSDLPYLEPILITDTGFVQVAPRGQRAFGELFAEPPAAHRPYRCAFCSQAFKKSSHLKQHVRSHTGEKPYKCQLCYRCFVSSGVLKAHMRTHSGVKSHQCHVCDSAFTTKGSLKRHMSTHSELRPFMCPYCQKTFKTTVNCKKHMKTHNKQEMSYSQVLRRIEDGVVDENADILLKDNVNVQVSDQQHEQQQQQEQQMDVEQPVVSQVPEMASQDQDMTLSETLSHLQHSLNQLSQQLDGHHDVELIGSDLVVGGEEVKTLHVHAFEQHAFEQFSAGGPFTLHTDASLPSQCTLDISGLDPDQVGLSGHELLADHQVGSHHDGVSGGVDLEGLDGGGCLEESSDAAVLNHQVSDVNGNVHADGLESTCVMIEQGVEGVVDEEEVDEDDGDDDNREEGEGLTGSQAEAEDQLKRIHKCTYCDSAFKRASHLKQHIRSHTGERPFKCQQCSHMFVSASALKGHLRTHVGAKDFKCHVCSAVFTTNGSLRRHMTVHSNVQPYKCVYCNESFRTQVMGKRHMRVHSNEMAAVAAATTTPVSTPATTTMTTKAVVSAVQRKRSSSKKPATKSPASIAHGSKPVVKTRKRTRLAVVQFTEEQTVSLASQTPNDFASVSEKILIASAVERDRLSEARDRPMPASAGTVLQAAAAPTTTDGTTVRHTHRCFHCPKSFKKPSDLSRHERIHTGEKPFQCELCKKTFTVKSTLDSHLKTHSGEKDFVCHVCNSRFATKGSLKVHMRLHTGAKPFKCSVCEQRFRTSGHRKSHMMVHLKGSAGTSSSSSSSSQKNKSNNKKKKPTRSAQARARPVNHKVAMATTESLLPVQSSSSSSTESQVLPPPSLPDKGDQGSAEGDQRDVIVAADATNLMTFGTNAVLDGGGGVYQLETLNSMNGDAMPNITVSLEGLTADQLITTDGVHLQGLQTIQIDASILQQLQQQGNVNITLDASFLTQGLTLESALLGGSDGVSEATSQHVSRTANASNVVLQPMSITLPLSINDQSTVNSSSSSYDQSINANDGCTEVSLSINEAGEMVTTVSKVLPEDAQLIQEVPVDSIAASVAAVAAAKRNQPKTFACEVCSKQFKRFANLKEHLSTHYPNGNGVGGGDIELRPPPLNYKCQVCSKQFGKPSQLERHLRIHTGERPFVCGVCDRAFNQRNALVIHMNKHTGDRPHLCFFCGQLFAQKGNLRVHVRRVHMKPVDGATAAVADVIDGQQQESAFEPSMMVGDCLDVQPDNNVSN